MKSILALLLRRSAMAGAIALAGSLAACGQKGPLYLPGKQPPAKHRSSTPSTPARPAQPAPAAPAQPAPDKSADPASE